MPQGQKGQSLMRATSGYPYEVARTFFLLFLGFQSMALGQNSTEFLEARAAENHGDDTSPIDPYEAILRIREAYHKLPFNTEMNPEVSRDGQTYEKNRRPLKVIRNEPLGHALEKFCATWSDLRLTTISDQVCIIPDTAGKKSRENALDIVIGVDIKDASPWEAVKTVVSSINSSHAFPFRLVLHPRCFAEEFPRFPPDEFWKSKIVSIGAVERPARDYICEIMKKSGMQMNYDYIYGAVESDSLIITLFDPPPQAISDEKELDEKNLFWSGEMHETGFLLESYLLVYEWNKGAKAP